jgi:hypothetical protein
MKAPNLNQEFAEASFQDSPMQGACAVRRPLVAQVCASSFGARIRRHALSAEESWS